MSVRWIVGLLAIAIVLLPFDWHCINCILKSITQKNGRQVLRDCSAFLALSTVICICFFVCTFARAAAAQGDHSVFQAFLKASWSIWALVAAMIFSGRAFWKKGKQLEADQAAADFD